MSESESIVSRTSPAGLARAGAADELVPPPGTRAVPEREGLPRSYRMRADAHYVEHLTTRRAERTGESSRAPGTNARVEQLFIELSDSLATIETAAAGLGSDGSRMGRRVNIDLLRSHTSRAAWALKAHALVAGADRARSRPRPLGFLLGRIRSAWAAECRLAGITLDVHASDWNAVVSVDEDLVVTGVTGAFVATMGLFDEAGGATLTLSATAASGRLTSVDLLQSEILVTPSEGGRFFDPSWDDRPGGWLAGLGAAAARAAAQRHGGDAIFLTDDDHGSTVRLQFGA